MAARTVTDNILTVLFSVGGTTLRTSRAYLMSKKVWTKNNSEMLQPDWFNCIDKKIFAKWKKKQYCVLMWEDQQLRIYDNAQVNSW